MRKETDFVFQRKRQEMSVAVKGLSRGVVADYQAKVKRVAHASAF